MLQISGRSRCAFDTAINMREIATHSSIMGNLCRVRANRGQKKLGNPFRTRMSQEWILQMQQIHVSGSDKHMGTCVSHVTDIPHTDRAQQTQEPASKSYVMGKDTAGCKHSSFTCRGAINTCKPATNSLVTRASIADRMIYVIPVGYCMISN